MEAVVFNIRSKRPVNKLKNKKSSRTEPTTFDEPVPWSPTVGWFYEKLLK